jgi:hypothetical protein
MNENDAVEEIDVSMFVKEIVIRYINGCNQTIDEPYELNQVLSVLSSATLQKEREVIYFLNEEDMQSSKPVETNTINNVAIGNELKTQVLEVLKDLFSSALSSTTKTTNKEALAFDQTDCQEKINNSFEGETWDGVDVPF